MTHSGATHDFLGGVLPDKDFRAEIFSLVEQAWPNVPSPRDAWLEPRITGLLKLAMVEAQETRYETDPPFHISEDTKIRDPKTGKEKERTDVEIYLRHHYIKGQRPYFVFESKRLNVPYGGIPSPNVHEYVGDGGMGCLLAGGYNTVPNYSGMLAYVMDGNIATAKSSVEKQLAHKSADLLLDGEARLSRSDLMPTGSHHGHTSHRGNDKMLFIVFHMFLPITSSSMRKR